MAAIDIGSGCANRSSYNDAGYTIVDKGNPANNTGKLTVFKTWFFTSATSGVKIGTVYGTSPNYTSRDYELIGAVTAGSEQTFSGLDCDVQTNDLVACYNSNGTIEYAATGGSGIGYYPGDRFGQGQTSYTIVSTGLTSLYGTGSTGAVEGAISDGEKSGDTFARKFIVTKQIADGAKLSDSLAQKIEATKGVSEGSNLGDALARYVEAIRNLLEGVEVGDGFSGIWVGVAPISEGAKAGDSFNAAIYSLDTFSISEGSRLGDAIEATSPIYVDLGEGMKAGDVFSTIMVYIGKRTEGAKLGDSFRWVPIILQAVEVILLESELTLATKIQSLITRAKLVESSITKNIRFNSLLDMSITITEG